MLSAAVATVLLVFFCLPENRDRREQTPPGDSSACVYVDFCFSCFFLSVVYFDLESKTTCTCHTTDQYYY